VFIHCRSVSLLAFLTIFDWLRRGSIVILPFTSSVTSVIFSPVWRSKRSSQVLGSVTAKLFGPALMTFLMMGIFMSPFLCKYEILIRLFYVIIFSIQAKKCHIIGGKNEIPLLRKNHNQPTDNHS